MTREEFWTLIDTSRTATGDDPDAQSEHIEMLLTPLPDDELVSFHTHFYALYHPTYRADLWGAAYIINGGCSDDGFDYFRAWVIGRGQAIYEAALASPDSLAAIAEDDCAEQEDLLSVAIGVWLKRHKKDWSDLEKGDDLFLHTPTPDLIGELEDWDENEKKLKKLYPCLYKKFW